MVLSERCRVTNGTYCENWKTSGGLEKPKLRDFLDRLYWIGRGFIDTGLVNSS